ncbi:MAG: ABC transporter permease, partial [Zestosphaera sp.]
MKVVYEVLVKIVNSYAWVRDKISPGWSTRNSSRIKEWKLMAYAFSKSKIGVLGGIIVFVVTLLAIIGPLLAWEPYWEYRVVENPELWYRPPCMP